MTAHPPPSAAAQPLPGTDFSVPGMRCAGCISKIEGKLPLAPGIVAARANFTSKRVRVSHLPDVTPPQIVRALAELGFEAQPLVADNGLSDSDDSKDLLKAMAVAGFAMMNIMLLSVSVWSGASGMTRDLFHWLSALIAMPTVVYSGRPFFRSAWSALRHGRTNMDVPISIGVVLATALSLFETVVSGPHAYFDGAVMLLFFLLAGRWLDSVMRDRAREGVQSLLGTMAAGALVIDNDGRSNWVDAQALKPGMIMLVAAGERLAADGEVIEGNSQFELSLLTGETAPQSVTPGALVHAGTLNMAAPVQVRVTAVGPDTAIAEIARLMEDAAQGKSRYVRIADRAARIYAPAVHLLATSSFAGWMIAGAGWHQSLLIAVAVLIITCPCALGLAVPAAQIVASGSLMKRGVLVKDGSALERLAEVDMALFDKTGTLTLGRPEPANLDAATREQKQVMLALARASRHPLSEALRRSLEQQGVEAATVNEVSDIPGTGVSGQWNGVPVSLRRPTVTLNNAMLATELVIGDKTPFLIAFEDAIRPDAATAIDGLKASGVPAAILSGDRATAVAPVARALGLTAQTAMLPADKLDAIMRQQRLGHRVLMVGDGLNDGPALAAGHASIAPASASDAGQIAADVVFLGDSLLPVLSAVRTARATQQIVRQNFALAIGYNVLAVPLAIFGLVTPLIAAIAMSTSSIIVVANALRLKRAGA
jgi:P-type Cu2+ transporter